MFYGYKYITFLYKVISWLDLSKTMHLKEVNQYINMHRHQNG